MPTKTWNKIEIGYELCSPNRGADPKEVALAVQLLSAALPGTLDDLCKIFDADSRLKWLQGGSTQVNTTTASHAWGSELLQKELNEALLKGGTGKSVSITESDLMQSSNPSQGGTAPVEKPVGTRCVLHGSRWHNYRTYRIKTEQLGVNTPPNIVFFATVWWDCDGARSDADSLLSQWLQSTRTS